MLFDECEDIAGFGDGNVFGDVVVETRGVIVDNVLIGVNKHEPFSVALFERSHALSGASNDRMGEIHRNMKSGHGVRADMA